jgi:hypothetical protein
VNVLERDFFTAPSSIRDPNPYYAALRSLARADLPLRFRPRS